MKEDLVFKNLYLEKDKMLLEHKLYGQKFFGIPLGNSNAIKRAYLPIVRYIIEEQNKFVQKVLFKKKK
mgnify:CR=1 FL=1